MIATLPSDELVKYLKDKADKKKKVGATVSPTDYRGPLNVLVQGDVHNRPLVEVLTNITHSNEDLDPSITSVCS